ncbi:MAG: hypothetical protein FWG25_08745 [Promicromonosporaceae bacterium]|nr:hypothetical protein [Promicromonosporaceae bacterium]
MVSVYQILSKDDDRVKRYNSAIADARAAVGNVQKRAPLITAYRVALEMALRWHSLVIWASAMEQVWNSKIQGCEAALRVYGYSDADVAHIRKVQQNLGLAP